MVLYFCKLNPNIPWFLFILRLNWFNKVMQIAHFYYYTFHCLSIIFYIQGYCHLYGSVTAPLLGISIRTSREHGLTWNHSCVHRRVIANPSQRLVLPDLIYILSREFQTGLVVCLSHLPFLDKTMRTARVIFKSRIFYLI